MTCTCSYEMLPVFLKSRVNVSIGMLSVKSQSKRLKIRFDGITSKNVFPADGFRSADLN